MRIVVTSDTHSLHGQASLPSGDVLVHAGDMTRMGTLDELREFNRWAGTLDFRGIFVIAGNHDFCFEREHDAALRIVKNFRYLQDQAFEFEGVKFYGTPWQPLFFNWAFNLRRGKALREKWDLIPDDTDVVIVHGPPHGHRDLTSGGDRSGCQELAAALERIQPTLCLFGHIHESYGVSTLGKTTCVNASIVDRSYKVANEPVVIDLVKGATGWDANFVNEVR